MMTARGSGRLESGAVLDGQYRVQRFLAAGGMGEVYLARDLTLERSVALKLLLGDDDATAAARFDREARLLSSVVHPNVVSVHAYGCHERLRFLVMEYVEGTSLREMLSARGRLLLVEAVELARQVASGLSEAHARGIVHRDVKPGNVLLRHLASGGWLAKVADFGLAKPGTWGQLPSLTQTAAAPGTVPYMAPEQIDPALCVEGGLDARVDQYALALVTYEMIAGQQPFRRENVAATLAAVVQAELPSLLEVTGDTTLPAEVDAVLRRAMARRPEARFPDVAAFCRALVRSIGGPTTEGGLTIRCPVCEAAGPAAAAYCISCGAGLPARTCLICGAAAEGHRYTCGDCGSRLLRPSRLTRHYSSFGAGEGEEAARPDRLGIALVMQWEPRPAPGDTRMFEGFVSAVEREGGRPVAVLGREAVALFGMHSAVEQDLERALDAALSLSEELRRTADGADRPAVRMGLEIGSLVTAGVGGAWGVAIAAGEAVTGARLAARPAVDDQGRAGVGVGPGAHRLARPLYDSEPDAGAGGRVLRRRHLPWSSALHPSRGHDIPLVGRELELAQLRRMAETVLRTGRLHVVPIIGAPGAGKSRLAAEGLEELAFAERDWHGCSSSQISGRASSHPVSARSGRAEEGCLSR